VAHAPRIYNLFPTLVGPVPAWHDHLPRIAGMGFDAVWLNPVHAPGESGDLYAIADPDRLNPALRNGGDVSDADLLSGFCAAAKRHGLDVLLDLVVRTGARDGVLAQAFPDRVRRPGRGAPPGTVAFDLEGPGADGLHGYWTAWVRRMLGQGVRGFRCVAAADVPPAFWASLIAEARRERGDALFVADTLGAPVERTLGLRGAGFDHLMSSARWWDLRAPWFPEQQRRLADVAPSIAFPESHDTPRVAAEAGTDDPEAIAARLRFAYMAAAAAGSGLMMPIGFEYGFKRPLDPARTTPADWEPAHADVTGFVSAANAVKASVAALNRELPLVPATGPGEPAVALVRRDAADGAAVVLLNPDPDRAHAVDGGPLLAAAGGGLEGLEDVTPFGDRLPVAPGRGIPLGPLEVRVFEGEPRRPGRAPDRAASRRALERLAGERVSIEAVEPEIDGGRFPAKRCVGDVLEVTADLFADGHDRIGAQVLWREAGANEWSSAPMAAGENDRWTGRVPLSRNTRYLYTVEAWRDPFESWRADTLKKRAAGQDLSLEAVEGADLVARARDGDRASASMREAADRLAAEDDRAKRLGILLSDEMRALMAVHGPRDHVTRYPRELEVVADRTAARFSAWYEMFPRSAAPGLRHGTFRDVIDRLPYVRDLGFDVLYFTPIHPIGATKRKGRNNSLSAGPDDPGSPYAIGSEAGGHDAVHPDLGTIDDFRALARAAAEQGLELALDFAIQCSPDHPWIREHPEWFEWRPDGSIKHAENPPKKYEDIVNVRFDGPALPDAWIALRDVVLFWAKQGVRIFRVDNPHTKPFPFWEWMIREVQARHPDTIFLSEAFTRPKPMYRLAKLGFTQSYTYFTWRNDKHGLVEYLTELTQGPPKDFFRPNFFVNTPDINPPYLQTGGRAAHIVRATLAATLSGVWGMYSGFEICEATPIPGKEEYLDAEKYEIKDWDFDRPGNIRGWIAALNRIRRAHPALQGASPPLFMPAHDDAVLCFGKAARDGADAVVVLANLDPHAGRGAWIELQPERLGLPPDGSYRMEDLVHGGRFVWDGRHHHVHLDPGHNPAMILSIAPA
jgi:starch synthase (maltosyl-transferring)